MATPEVPVNVPIPLGEIPINITNNSFAIVSAGIATILVIRGERRMDVLSYNAETTSVRFDPIPYGESFGITKPDLPPTEEHVILNLNPIPKGVEVSSKGIKANAIPVAQFPPRDQEQTVSLGEKIWTKVPISEGLRIMIGDRYRIKVAWDGTSYKLYYRSGNDYYPFLDAQRRQIIVSDDTPFSFCNNSNATIQLPYDSSESFLGGIIHEGNLYIYGSGSIALELPKQPAWGVPPKQGDRR